MVPETETAALVALLLGADGARRRDTVRLARTGGACAALAAEHGLLAEAELERARRQIVRWRKRGIRVLCAGDDAYPGNLRSLTEPPALLFLAGELTAADRRAVAVVGTRQATDEGLRTARRLAEYLVQSGYTVVSGLAAGIDTAAHTAALAAGGRTVAVIGTGLERCFPSRNAGLQREIARRCAVLSQFHPESAPTRHSFPMRNEVMAGATLATVIVEASYTSGTRTQARFALAQGRPVVLLSSLLAQGWARELAQRPGVTVADSPAEVTAAVERRGCRSTAAGA